MWLSADFGTVYCHLTFNGTMNKHTKSWLIQISININNSRYTQLNRLIFLPAKFLHVYNYFQTDNP